MRSWRERHPDQAEFCGHSKEFGFKSESNRTACGAGRGSGVM